MIETFSLKIQKESLPFLNMSLYLNNIKFIHSLLIENESETDSESVDVEISSDISCINKFSYNLSSIPARKIIKIPLDKLKLNREFLNKLSETEKAEITIKVLSGTEFITSETFSLEVQPLEHFGGFSILPELIASFVTPNHSYVYHLKRKAIEMLGSQGLKTAFDGYQSDDPERVLQIMSALFTVIQNEQIIYSSLSPGYEETGQRLRLLNTIQKEKFANCIDISLLFAACLEAADLHPLLMIVKGHAFVGCWLNDDKFSEVVNEDKAAITKRISKGIREIAVIEATTMCKGNDIRFTEALQLGEAQLIEKENFLFSIDIKTARSAFIRPLPLMNTEAVKLDMEEIEKVATGKMEDKFEVGKIYADELLNGSRQPKTKQKIWERKLLDLSLRNNLLNIRFSRNMLQMIDIDINALEDILSDGKSFSIQPHPNAIISAKYNQYYASLHSSSVEFQKANEELMYNRLLTYYHQKDLDSILTFMDKNAKQAIDENGSSTLFLGIGLLQWFDRKTPSQPRLSPILLLPVEISRRSVNSKFTLRSREEETMINITLLEFLRQEYEMNLSGLEQLPQDEKGVDVAKVMGIFRRAIMQLAGWDVKEQLVLGNFSFSKLILWNDLVIHQDKLLDSDMVRSLVEGKLMMDDFHDRDFDDFEKLKSNQMTLPISTDMSQMDAVLSAQKGQSFILHGPPGSGKSQTITNIIADALYRGKRVLFVAAKKAALDVVHKRLKQIGLEPFALELHSNKSKKTEVLERLGKSLETLRQGQVANFDEESQRLDTAKKAISNYVNLLHKQQPVGWSLYNSLTALENYRNNHFSKNFISEDVLEKLNANLWQQWNDWLPQFEAITSIIIHPSENPLASLQISRYSFSLSDEIQKETIKLLTCLPLLKNQLSALRTQIDFPFPVESRKELESFENLAQNLEVLPNTSLEFARYLSQTENESVYEDWNKYFGSYQSSLKNILKDYNRSVLDLKIIELETLWNEATQSWFLPKWLKKRKVKKQFNIHRKQPVQNDSELEEFFPLHRQMQEANRLLQQNRFTELVTALKSLYKEEETNLPDIETRVNIIRFMVNGMSIWGYHTMGKWIQELIQNGINYSDEIKRNHSGSIRQFRETVMEFKKQEKEFNEMSGYYFRDEKGWLDESVREIEKIQGHLPQLKNWMNYQQICALGKNMDLEWFIMAYENKDCSVNELSDYFHFTTHVSIIRRIIAGDESLSLFNSGLFESKIEHYKQIAEEYKMLTIQEMRGKLASQLPHVALDAMQSSEPGILQKAIRGRGRGMSIRKLFDQIPNLLPRLAPCMLMSPISVAQYFDMDTKHFDLLIFDEASQLPTCEAVSSLARAGQAIIVGDPKQMPPTSFFTTTKLDEENIEIEDLESILDDCLSLSVPSKYLLRHYRSKHESLIAFSNINYYENKLLTFPSADDLHRKVQYHYVPGFYDKGKTRTNKFEADAIVQFVKEHFENETKSKFSIGVVTFSQTQQTLIEDKLEQLYSLHPLLEEWANNAEEPLFVKNLENVQGDERDIILFSIGYGPDESGIVSMNFGPLNRNGGWRRLNVAVTRSRYEMHVFATLKGEQIDLNRTAAEGVAGLKAFLNFAEKGQLAIQPKEGNGSLSKQQLSEFVRSRLTEKGMNVKCDIGTSDFKIDVGIIHPEKPHQFLLGILIDGDYYFHAKTSNDRELVMPSVLKSLGWNIHRVWSLDWHENADQIIEGIVEKVKRILEEPEQETTALPRVAEKHSFEPMRFMPQEQLPDTPASLQKPYVPHTITPVAFSNSETILEFQNRNTVKQQIQNVIETEAPVSKSMLYKKVLQAWNISRAGARLDRFLEEVIAEMNITQSQHQQPFYFSSKNGLTLTHYRSNETEKRKIEDIAPEEIMVALEEAVRNHLSIEEDELIKYLARIFDFGRVGRQVDSLIRYAIGLAVKEKRVVMEGSRVKIS